MEHENISQRVYFVRVRFSEPTPEDIQAYADDGFNIDFSERVKVTVTDEHSEASGYCFMKRENVERLGKQYIADHATLEPFFDGYRVIVSENDWYNDLRRNPERVIVVSYVGQECGTGRELYKDEDGNRYAREVYFPRESCAKWYCYGKDRSASDGWHPRPNTIFEYDGRREKVTFDDWNNVMAYSGTFNVNFRKGL